ncbi:MAG: hypothetical protein KJ593_02595 [Candidatus Omnitrophica bacterium]|nr:hypothetical protein [Candidatus Omnitrophota bacterium]
MLKKILITLGFLMVTAGLVFVSSCAFCESQARQDVTVEFQGRYWVTDLDTEAKVVESNVGAKFDFKTDLGIGDEDFPEGRIIWHIGPNNKIRLGYTQVDYSGDQSISRTIEFKGQSYTSGAQVKSDLDITYLRFGWLWQFVDLFDGGMKFGTILEAKGILADVSLDAPALTIKESEEFFGVLPTVGVTLDINPVKKMNLFAEISGISAGDYGYFFDAEAGIKILPFKNLDIVGGYRMIDIEAEDDPDFFQAQISGPFLAATLKF